MKTLRPGSYPLAKAGSRNMPWPVLFYLPRPGPAPQALSALQGIVIPLTRQFVTRIIRYVFLTAGSHRVRIEGAALRLFRRAYRDPHTRRSPEGPGCNHPCLLAYLIL